MRKAEVTLTQAAALLAASYNQTMRLVLVGALKGEQRRGRWFVDARDLERLVRLRRAEDGSQTPLPGLTNV